MFFNMLNSKFDREAARARSPKLKKTFILILQQEVQAVASSFSSSTSSCLVYPSPQLTCDATFVALCKLSLLRNIVSFVIV